MLLHSGAVHAVAIHCWRHKLIIRFLIHYAAPAQQRIAFISLISVFVSLNWIFPLSFVCLQGIYHRLGDVFMRLKKWSEAERFHRAALEAEPNHIGAHISYGTMLARNVSTVSWCSIWRIVMNWQGAFVLSSFYFGTLEQSIIRGWAIFQASNSFGSTGFQRASSLW